MYEVLHCINFFFRFIRRFTCSIVHSMRPRQALFFCIFDDVFMTKVQDFSRTPHQQKAALPVPMEPSRQV
jgi:hypothetical protein